MIRKQYLGTRVLLQKNGPGREPWCLHFPVLASQAKMTPNVCENGHWGESSASSRCGTLLRKGGTEAMTAENVSIEQFKMCPGGSIRWPAPQLQGVLLKGRTLRRPIMLYLLSCNSLHPAPDTEWTNSNSPEESATLSYWRGLVTHNSKMVEQLSYQHELS